MELQEAVEQAKKELKYRTESLGLDSSNIADFQVDGAIYVMSNPVVWHETTVYGDEIPRHNITAWYKDGHFDDSGKYVINCGILPIPFPQLIIKLDLEGNILADGYELVQLEAMHG